MFDQQTTADRDPEIAPVTTRADKDRAEYERRKLAGECTRCGDQAQEADQLCASCRTYANTKIRTGVAKLYAKRRQRGQCARCGRKSVRYECLDCLRKRGRAPIGRPNPTLNQKSSSISWHTEGRKVQVRSVTEGDGRTRNRGIGQARRGRMSRSAEDEQDMRDAQVELEAAKQAVAHAHSPEVKAMGEIRARAVLLAALDRVDLAARFLATILARHKYVR